MKSHRLNIHSPLTFALLMASGLAPLGGCGQSDQISGTATYRERIALPPDCVLEVVLEDISRADAASQRLGSTVLEDPGQPPYDFTIAFDPATIAENGSYAVRARIVDAEGKLIFTTDQVYPVLTRGHGKTAELLLVRVARARESGPRAMRGMFRYQADAALFTDCASRRRLPVATTGDYEALERAYLELRPGPDTELLATFEGRIEDRPATEGEGSVATVVVERFEGVWPGETCGNPRAVAELEDHYWKLTRLGDQPVRVFPNQREPYLVLRQQEQRVTGSTGCNQFSGSYELDGDTLRFDPLAGTMKACLEGMDQERAFLAALGEVAHWRIEGQHLELLDEDGGFLLRLEERALP